MTPEEMKKLIKEAVAEEIDKRTALTPQIPTNERLKLSHAVQTLQEMLSQPINLGSSSAQDKTLNQTTIRTNNPSDTAITWDDD